jgi:hypothetical protein
VIGTDTAARALVCHCRKEKRDKPWNQAEGQEALVEFLAQWPVDGARDRPWMMEKKVTEALETDES